MRLALLLIVLMALTMPAASRGLVPELEARIKGIYAERIYERQSASVRWLPDGDGYTQHEVSQNGVPEVVRYSASDGSREVIFSLAELKAKMKGADPSIKTINGYALSNDSRFVLARGDFYKNSDGRDVLDLWLLDRANGGLRKIARSVTQADPANALSPDGRRVLFGRNHNLFVYDSVNGATRQLTHDGIVGDIGNGIADDRYSFVRWSPDSSRIAFLQTDSRKVGRFPLIDNTAADYPTVRYTRYVMVGTPMATQRLGVVNAGGGRVRWVDLETAPGTFLLDTPQWTNDSRQIVIEMIARAGDWAKLVVADATTGKSRTLRHDKSDSWVRDSGIARDGGFNWIEEGKTFVWLSETDGWRRAYAVENSIATPLTPAGVDVIGNPTVDLHGGWLYYTASPANATQRYLYRARLDGRGQAQRVTPPDQPGTHSYDISPNARWAFHTYSTADTPPVTDLIELSGHRRVRLLEDNARLRERLKAWAPAPTEFFKLAIGEGVVMDAWMLKPRDFDPSRKYPVLVFVYGEPASQAVVDAWGNGQGRNLFHRAIADAGYLVVAMDNRGTPAPKGTAWRRAVFGSLGPLSTEEQAAGLRELGHTRGYVDLSRVAIWGWSAGGTNTLNALFRKPDQYHVGIAVAAKPRPELYNPFQETYMRTPQVNPQGYRDAAPYNFAEGLKGDLLIIHGTGETNTHLQIVEHLVNRLIELGKPFDYMTYPNRSHGINEGPGTTPHLSLLIARYLTEHLPAGGR